MIENGYLIVQHEFQIKNGITKLVNINVKVIVHAKYIIDGIITHVLVRIASI